MPLMKLLRFSKFVGQLKDVKRSGWISHAGIQDAESVADHSFRCAVLAMCIGDIVKADTDKLMRMLLLHDLQESLTSDLDSYAKEEIGIMSVKTREKTAISNVLSLLPAELRSRYLSLWEEFAGRATPEAILANDIDKIEMLMQALEYEARGHDSKKLDAFWQGAQNKIRTPVIQDLLEKLRNRRNILTARMRNEK